MIDQITEKVELRVLPVRIKLLKAVQEMNTLDAINYLKDKMEMAENIHETIVCRECKCNTKIIIPNTIMQLAIIDVLKILKEVK